jgi:hypothetical protein
LGISGRVNAKLPVPQPTSRTTVTVRKATKPDQRRRESTAPPSHDLFVGVGVSEAGGSGGVGIGHRCNLLPRQPGDDLRPRIGRWAMVAAERTTSRQRVNCRRRSSLTFTGCMTLG